MQALCTTEVVPAIGDKHFSVGLQVACSSDLAPRKLGVAALTCAPAAVCPACKSTLCAARINELVLVDLECIVSPCVAWVARF